MLSGSRDTRGTPYFDPLAFKEQGFVNLTEHKAITGELGTTAFQAPSCFWFLCGKPGVVSRKLSSKGILRQVVHGPMEEVCVVVITGSQPL